MPRWPERTPHERGELRRATKAAKDARYYARYHSRIRERQAEYYEANKELVRAGQAVYRLANRDTLLANGLREKYENREYYRAKSREYFKVNPEKCKEYVHRRRARLRGAEGTYTSDDIARILKMQRARCGCCSGRLTKLNTHIDHIFPLAKGGSNYPANLQLLCADCNRSKGAKHPNEFMQLRGFLL
jgi:5-methylcytosine-specific restriction endonuclease McrA